MHIRLLASGWLRRMVAVAALSPAFVHCGLAAAQATSNDPNALKFFNKEANFALPIKIDDRLRNSIQEVQLHVKLPGGEWQFKDKAAPWEQAFKFKAPADGEYWFTLVTINGKGEPNPPDLNRLPARDIVMVVVDTRSPTVDLQPMKLANGDLQLRCNVSDANPDVKSLKISYRGLEQAMRSLEPVPGQPGTFRVPSADIFANPLKVVVADLAGNMTAKEINLQDAVAKIMSTATTIAAAGNQAPPASGVQQAVGSAPNPIGGGVLQNASNQSIVNNHQQGDTKPAALTSAPTANPANTGSIQKQLISTTRASLEYRIDQIGSSGVGKVDVYMTADSGASWKRLCEDADRRSPGEFDLPGDGLFGVRVVLTNGNGIGGRPPAQGEQPQLWIEVDTLAPVVKLKEFEPPASSGTLDIRWLATDKNLGPDAINLYYATSREGPWQSIARNVKNDGLHRWTFPREGAAQFFIRLEAVDQAGNVARCDSPNAIVLDMTEPRASVLGVSGVQQGSQVKGN